MGFITFIEDIFIPKECRYNDPWEAKGNTIEEKRKDFTDCAAKKIKVRFIIAVVVVLILMIIMSIVVGISNNSVGAGIGLFIVGSFLLIGGSYAGTFWWQRRQATIKFDGFETVWKNDGEPAFNSREFKDLRNVQANEANARRK